MAKALMQFSGIGLIGAWILASEICGWREFRNRREVGAVVGLTPTPYSSGTGQRERGISKAGNRRARSLLVELSWLWLRYKPASALSQWFLRRFSAGGKNLRRLEVSVGVAYGTDVQKVRRLLLAIAAESADTLDDPAPMAIFAGFDESSLDFQLYFWIAQYEDGLRVASDLRTAISRRLQDEQIDVPFPQRDVQIRTGNLESRVHAISSGL